MVFSSMVFIFIFLPVVVLLYYIFPWRAWRNTLLCLSSLIFYAWGEPLYVFLMLLSVLLNYFSGLLLNRISGKKTAALVLSLSVLLNLSALFFFKYADFFISNINSLFSLDIKTVNLPLPIGISFYTFQALSYVIDVYRKRIEPQRNPVYLAMYIAFFPQLIAGPIVRYTDIEKDINDRKESLECFSSGLIQFFFGLASKVILANNLAVFADSVFSDFSEADSLIMWLAAAAYMLQIFFDFAGYSIMAIGLGRMFGFSFPVNFNKPYTALSVTDFWRRWHITLSSWFRDYVYIPLGGNRCHPARHIFNILVTWLLTGFWHGAEWNFIIWGLYYAFFLIIEKYLFSRFMKSRVFSAIYRLFTLFIVLIGWVIFRVENLGELGRVLNLMFSFRAENTALYIVEHAADCGRIFYMIPGILAASSFPGFIAGKIGRTLSPSCFLVLKALIAFILFLLSVMFLIASSYNPFIYFRF
ncbi:MAG: MBOAT family protein [Treponemataceae bacterium]|nr:MBOAT family protein [Treponemataceae bacterium]